MKNHRTRPGNSSKEVRTGCSDCFRVWSRAACCVLFFFFSSIRRHTRCYRDWSSDVCSSDLTSTRLRASPQAWISHWRWSRRIMAGRSRSPSRQLVLFLKRPGGQSQFSAQLSVQAADREPLRAVQLWIADHLDADLSVPVLARRAAMSERNFSRRFARETGATPGDFVLRARVEAARRRLEESSEGVDAIAAQCGFGSAEVMRRAFLRTLRVPPSAYRMRFRSA